MGEKKRKIASITKIHGDMTDEEAIKMAQDQEAKALQDKAKAAVSQEKREFMKQYVLHRALACKDDNSIEGPEEMTKDAAQAWEIIAATQLERWQGDEPTN